MKSGEWDDDTESILDKIEPCLIDDLTRPQQKKIGRIAKFIGQWINDNC